MSKIKDTIIKRSASSSLWFRIYWKLHNINLQRQMKLTDEEYARQSYESATGRVMDLANPKYFAEKLWWLKLYYRNPLQTKCADKYAVREYVENCGLGHILNDIYGVYDNVDEIDFASIESPCFIKCTSGSGKNVIYDRSRLFDIKYFKTKFRLALKHNYYYDSREWPYKDVKPRLICEKVLRQSDGSLPIDYRIFCFHGKPRFLYLNNGAANESGAHREETQWSIYDTDCNRLPYNTVENGDSKANDLESEVFKPAGWEMMIEYAEILSKPFPHCRVDLYNVDGKIYFGEITFFHCGGSVKIEPEQYDLEVGSWIDLKKITQEHVSTALKGSQENVDEQKSKEKSRNKKHRDLYNGLSGGGVPQGLESVATENSDVTATGTVVQESSNTDYAGNQIGEKQHKQKSFRDVFAVKLAISYLHCIESKILPLFVSDEKAVKKYYKRLTGKELNLENPQTFCEKTNWLKLNDRNPLMVTCADKFAVREYVTNKGYGDCLNELYGVYDKVSDINIDELPDRFVLKATHGSHMNIVVKDKSKINWHQAKMMMRSWLRQDIYWSGREWPYKEIPRRIIAEKYLEDKFGELRDYRFFCFHGKPNYVEYDVGLLSDRPYRNYYDMNQKLMEFSDGTERNENIALNLTEQTFDKMKKMARTLSDEFQQCRVDLFLVNGKIYVGELTFFDAGGSTIYRPNEWNYKFSENWIINQ